MTDLRIGTGFSIPREAVTQTFAILAKRGVGKTYTALVLVEELLKASLPVVVVDPIGVAWGLRTAADGHRPGLPIVVLGGERGDVPLEVTGGKLTADFVVDEGASAVLDLSLFRKAEQVRFMTDFAETLYHRNRKPLQLVLDEADAFAPQKPQRGQERMLGAVEDLVRRGRARGIGVTLITQRSAVLNKDVLTQVEVLVALRTIAPQDRAAIDAWVQVHGTPEQREELMASLPSLPIGTAWFWSPGWLDVFRRVKVRQRETFDSSATPKVGQRVRAPQKVADVDLEALRRRMAESIERAKADDPKALRARVAQLERELAARPAAKPERVEVPVLKPADLARLEKATDALEKHLHRVLLPVHMVRAGLVKLGALPALAPQSTDDRAPVPRQPTPAAPAARREPPPARATRAPAARTEGVTGPRQRILDALAWLESVGIRQADRTQLALLSDASPKSSAYANNLGALRTAGLVEYPAGATVALTDAGQQAARAPDRPPTTDDLQRAVLGKVSRPQARILETLLAAYPGAVDRDALAERVEASAVSSAYANNLGALRTLGFVTYPTRGAVAAAPVLFLEGR